MKGFICALLILFSSAAAAETIFPTSFSEWKDATVMVTNSANSSGGTGVILKSTSSGSTIMTNAHVCAILKRGGYIHTTRGKFFAQKFIKSKVHDLCLVKVDEDLEINTKVASNDVSYGDEVVVSGHPHLLPNVVSTGHATEKITITLLSEVTQCTPSDWKKVGFLCWLFDGMPIIKTLEIRVTSALIAPGNSGSPVWNSSGEIVGLVFAGHGRGLSHGLIVPHTAIKAFLSIELKKTKWTKVKSSRSLVDYFEESLKDTPTPGEHYTPDFKGPLFFNMIEDNKMDRAFSVHSCIREGNPERCVK